MALTYGDGKAGNKGTRRNGNAAYDVLVSCCDDPDFDGDWRYSAFCPDRDVAMDGRTVDEALQRVKDAIAVKVADSADGRLPALSSELKAAALADFLSDGRLVWQTTAAATVR